MAITLRALTESDLETLFVWESDPRAVEMAAFTRADPSDCRKFDAHYDRVRKEPANLLLAIDDDEEFVGTVGSFTMEGEREVTYWIAPPRWGQGPGVAGPPGIPRDRADWAAVRSRGGSQSRVGESACRAGFVEVGSETAFAPGVGANVLERIYRLDQ